LGRIVAIIGASFDKKWLILGDSLGILQKCEVQGLLTAGTTGNGLILSTLMNTQRLSINVELNIN
jgi:hypothetical protein